MASPISLHADAPTTGDPKARIAEIIQLIEAQEHAVTGMKAKLEEIKDRL